MIRVLQQDFYNTGFTNTLLRIDDASINQHSTFGNYILGNNISTLVQNYVFIPDYISIQFNTSKELFFKCTSTTTSNNITTYSYSFYAVDSTSIKDDTKYTVEQESLKYNISIKELGYNPEGTLDYDTYYKQLIGDNYAGGNNLITLVQISQDLNQGTLRISFPHWIKSAFNKNYLKDKTQSNPNGNIVYVSIFTKDKKDIAKNNYKFNRIKHELDLCYNYEKDSSGSFSSNQKLNTSTNSKFSFYLCPSIGKYNIEFKPNLTTYQTPKTINETETQKLIAINEDDLFYPKNKMKTIHINASWGKDLDYMSEEEKNYIDSAILELSNYNTESNTNYYIQIGNTSATAANTDPYIKLNLGNSLTNIGDKNYALKTIRLGGSVSNYSEINLDVSQSRHMVYYGTNNGELKPRYDTLINLFNSSFYKTKPNDFNVYLYLPSIKNGTQISLLDTHNIFTPENPNFTTKTEVFKNMFGNTSTFYSTYDATDNIRNNGVEQYVSNSSAWFTVDVSNATTTEDSMNINFGLRMNYATGLKDSSPSEPSIQDYNNSIKYVDLYLGANYEDTSIYNIAVVTTEDTSGDIFSNKNSGNVHVYLRNYGKNGIKNPDYLNSTFPFFPAAKIAQHNGTGTNSYNFNCYNSSIWINGVLQTISKDSNSIISPEETNSLQMFRSGVVSKTFIERNWHVSEADEIGQPAPYIKLWFEIETNTSGYSYWKLCGDVSLGGVHLNDSDNGQYYFWQQQGDGAKLSMGVYKFATDKSNSPYRRYIETDRCYLNPENSKQTITENGHIFFNPRNSNVKNHYYTDYLNKPCLPLWLTYKGNPCICIPYFDPTSTILKSDVIAYKAQ